ncbi:MAG: beta-lactamase family protein [Thermomicrobiales bacterium]|nr:beta-lactamase family protein [Thermomicrobiales bacterium]
MTNADRTWIFGDKTRVAVDTIFSRFTNSTPGCALAIYRGGEIVYANGYGMSNLEHNVPITPDSIFHIASISKQFTAMCIALLQGDGLLDVDDPVQKYVPELPTYDYPITVRHLIHHVSGIRDQWVLLHLAGWRSDDLITEADCFDLIRRQQELNFPPNQQYMYSNSGYTLLAMIVKAVSGLSLREFAQQRIFGPLGMTRTHFHDDHTEIVPGRTQAYEPRSGGGYHISIPPFDVVGTTSLQTTVADFAKWNHNFDAPTICSPEILKMVQTPGVFSNGEPMDYAWGLTIDTWRGQNRVGHDGADHGYRSSYFRLPDLDFGITVFANLSTITPSQLAERVAAVVLTDVIQEEAISPNESQTAAMPLHVEASAIAGIYTAASTGEELPQLLDLRVRDGEIEMAIWDTAVALPMRNDGTFDFRDGSGFLWATELEDDGNAAEVVFRFGQDDPIIFHRIETDQVQGAPLQSFVGDYYSPELGTKISLDISSDQTRLIWKQRKLEDREIFRISETMFGTRSLGAAQHLEFEIDADSRISSFRFTTGRTSRLRYERQA